MSSISPAHMRGLNYIGNSENFVGLRFRQLQWNLTRSKRILIHNIVRYNDYTRRNIALDRFCVKQFPHTGILNQLIQIASLWLLDPPIVTQKSRMNHFPSTCGTCSVVTAHHLPLSSTSSESDPINLKIRGKFS